MHYSAFNSTFLTPKVASSYQLTRNGYTAILNISVLDRASLGKPATEAKLTGHAKNLIGNLRELSFKQVKEGNAIYYLAEVPISNEEMLTFDIDVDAGLKGAGKLTSAKSSIPNSNFIEDMGNLRRSRRVSHINHREQHEKDRFSHGQSRQSA